MAVVGAIASIISATVNISLAVVQAKNQRKSAAYNAAVKRNQATEVENAEVTKRGDLRSAMARQIAYQRAAAAAKGISLDSTTSLSIFSDTEFNTETEIERLRYNTAQKATALRQGAELGLAEGRNAAIGTLVGGVGDFVGEVGEIAEEIGKSAAGA